ncbi:hypothetical protein RFI_02667 [Reticulomyxa filosa]|uniref:Uncharacterized protein n=1 Tax=Reticulomyxa filosa TaxID=46433 RepID=X6P7E0_RETFI|nr:hypothetical protein RFI_02667 [Reticulomyxa filosa]|eukprot:ETO34425.1 hypothetical protein RFI_02667 [Reticulomyxa filosa]
MKHKSEFLPNNHKSQHQDKEKDIKIHDITQEFLKDDNDVNASKNGKQNVFLNVDSETIAKPESNKDGNCQAVENAMQRQVDTMIKQLQMLTNMLFSQKIQCSGERKSESHEYNDTTSFEPEFHCDRNNRKLFDSEQNQDNATIFNPDAQRTYKTLDEKETHQLSDAFCSRYVVTQCMSKELQAMISSNKVNSSFKELILCIFETFGGKHRIAECTSEILQFSTKFNGGLYEILLRLHKAKFEEDIMVKRTEISKIQEKIGDFIKDKEDKVNLMKGQHNNDRNLASYVLTYTESNDFIKSILISIWIKIYVQLILKWTICAKAKLKTKICQHLKIAQFRYNSNQIRFENKNKLMHSFVIGNKVLLYFGDQRTFNNAKLQPKFVGPYEIIEQVGPSTVKIVSEKGFLKLDAGIDITTNKENENRDPGFKQTETHQSDQTKTTLVINQPQVSDHSKLVSSEEISINQKEIIVKTIRRKSKHKLKIHHPSGTIV